MVVGGAKSYTVAIHRTAVAHKHFVETFHENYKEEDKNKYMVIEFNCRLMGNGKKRVFGSLVLFTSDAFDKFRKNNPTYHSRNQKVLFSTADDIRTGTYSFDGLFYKKTHSKINTLLLLKGLRKEPAKQLVRWG